MKKEIGIIGAGLVGSLLGIFLAKRGFKVAIYERRGDMRKEQVEAGRSINLALSDRGIKALQTVGIADEVLEIAIPMYGRSIHNTDGNNAFQPYGKEGQYINSVSRRVLNCKLMDIAESQGIEIFFDRKCERIDFETNTLHFDHYPSASADVIFGADGAYSAARMSHMLQHSQFDYHQYYIDCGYKELAFPAGKDGSFRLEKNALHIWPRKEFMLIALPNTDGSFTGTLFFPFTGDPSFESLETRDDVHGFFSQNFPDVFELIPDLVDQYFHNPTSSLVTVKCFPWVRNDRFCLIGDAAHAIVPFFGQGMNAGFEDCTILDQLLEKHGDDWSVVLEEFQQQRKIDTDAIADLAVNNFTEMRERTADPNFLLQKKIEARLHAHHPEQWIPAYSQVTFSPEIRYSEALRRSVQQEAIMQHIMRQDNIGANWESEEVEKQILSHL